MSTRVAMPQSLAYSPVHQPSSWSLRTRLMISSSVTREVGMGTNCPMLTMWRLKSSQPGNSKYQRRSTEFVIRDILGCCCTLLRLPVECMIYDPLVGRGGLGDFRLVYLPESPRKRAIRHPMPPLSPPRALSPGDSQHTNAKVCSAPKCPERPTWGEKAQDSESPSTPQAPIRSALASINIVMACTSSLMITSALGSAVTISLPYMGKDLNIRKGDLQWILSAYS